MVVMTGPIPDATPSNVIPLSAPPTRRSTRVLLAVWLAHVIGVNGVFTVLDAEQMILSATGTKRVEIDRRIRELREVGWLIANSRTDPGLRSDQHRLVRVGDMIWHKNYRWPQGRTRCPGPVRRIVFMRDGRVCQVCGIGDGQPYPEDPGYVARMTIGRILPGSRGGSYTVQNCQVECSQCNEAVQDRYDYGGEAA